MLTRDLFAIAVLTFSYQFPVTSVDVLNAHDKKRYKLVAQCLFRHGDFGVIRRILTEAKGRYLKKSETIAGLYVEALGETHKLRWL